MEAPSQTVPERIDDAFVLRSLFSDAEAEQYAANRREARRCEALADVLEYARRHPELYVSADPDGPDPLAGRAIPPLGGDAELATRCAVAEAGSRLNFTEHQVRSLASTAQHARTRLPLTWHAAREGLLTVAHVEAILGQLPVFGTRPELVGEFDRLLSEVALHATVGATRHKARDVADRLTSRTRTQRHAEAFARRRVEVEDVADGMAWVHALVSAERAHAADRGITATAKNMTTDERDGRTHAQLRADLFADLLTGVGPDRMVTTKVFVTIPLDRLSPAARTSVRSGTSAATSTGTSTGTGLDLNRDCLIPGEGRIDDATARQLLLDAGAFTRVITDPVSGVILDMDRRSRRATRAQRDWLVLRHGTCLRDGCTRLAIDADIDHHCAYHGRGRGATDIDNLDPLCDPDHAMKDTTRIRHRRRDDGTIEREFPTGHRTANPFAGIEERVRALLDRAGPYADDPPF
nr:HNH endonuclease signature motif containing protein [Microbacterium bovistercoris]